MRSGLRLMACWIAVVRSGVYIKYAKITNRVPAHVESMVKEADAYILAPVRLSLERILSFYSLHYFSIHGILSVNQAMLGMIH